MIGYGITLSNDQIKSMNVGNEDFKSYSRNLLKGALSYTTAQYEKSKKRATALQNYYISLKTSKVPFAGIGELIKESRRQLNEELINCKKLKYLRRWILSVIS